MTLPIPDAPPTTTLRRADLLALAPLLLALALRLHALNLFVASDELRWTCRSVNFAAALAEGRPAGTFQVGHPGVVTMWLGAIAAEVTELGELPALCASSSGGTDFGKLDDRGQEGRMRGFAAPLFGLRRGMAWGTTVMLALIYLLLRAGLGWRLGAALGALTLLAAEPFLVAHSRLLHVDAPVALMSLAAVAALGAAIGRWSSRRWWAGAGTLAGAAALAKSSALLLGPLGVAAILVVGRRDWRRAATRSGGWALAAGLAYAALWPAMWVDPVGTLTRTCAAEAEDAGACAPGVLAKAAEEGGQPHPSGNYFMGRPVADPGPLFYPAALLWRLMPPALLGLALALGLAARGGWARLPEGSALLAAWAIVFLVAIGLGPKKFDRYALPAMVALVALAGGALGGLASGWLERRGWREVRAAALGAALLALAQLASLRAGGPDSLAYPLLAYQPLLGGAEAAERVLLVGWGEGYDLAAAFLNARPGAEAEVASVRGLANFAPLYRGATRSAAGYEPGRTDHVVLYRSEVQRRQPDSAALVAMLQDAPGQAPEFTGRLNGVPMAWVYGNPTLAPLEAAIGRLAGEEDALVAGGETVFARRYAGTRPLARYWGHQTEADLARELPAQLPAGWARLWVIRYPGQDPPAALAAMGRLAEAGQSHTIRLPDGSHIDLTPFHRDPRSAPRPP